MTNSTEKNRSYRKRHRNSPRYKALKYISALKVKGIRISTSVEDITQWLINKPKSCELCDRPAKCLDHCHRTGKVRGWLCIGCNTLIGRIEEYLRNLEKQEAINKYLSRQAD